MPRENHEFRKSATHLFFLEVADACVLIVIPGRAQREPESMSMM
ncbi:hypothetical protein ACQR16_08360 [Bradyrhizobium oligotrophicum]